MSARIVVLKFGGTSVSSKERWETIEEIARKRLTDHEIPFIVCSALSGVSNLLEGLLTASVHKRHEPILEELRKKHQDLATSLHLDADALLGAYFEKLARYALGTSLIGEVGPRLQACVMATGELMSTTLGAAFLKSRGLAVEWRDARAMLSAEREENTNMQRHYLSSACLYTRDEVLSEEVQGGAQVILTQGFIARDEADETVLLGRGGSDTSAAYFAAKLGAVRLEIWTDVPGMFTANPRQIPSARLLRRLDYMEAQELATTGAKVLHPRCLAPVRESEIPLYIKCTPYPDLEGTIISSDVPDFGAQVKAISAKQGIPLVSMEALGMWQEVGFLSSVFDRFKRNGLSIDLVATSETNVTVSLDPVANALDETTMDRLLVDLSDACQAKTLGPCAAVSIVGRNIRAILHKLGPAFELFEQQRIYMMSQSSSDLNMTFVVDEDQSDRLVRKLHALIFGDRAPDELVGPTWRELFSEDAHRARTHTAQAHIRWWVTRRKELLEIPTPGKPAYVYHGETLDYAIDELKSLDALSERFFAMKANSNEDILRRFEAQGMSFECVSPGELDCVFGLFGNDIADRVLFTPNFAPVHEYEDAFERGVRVTIDNLHPLKHHPKVFAGRDVLVRLDPGVGKGHHRHVRTAGASSKFGVACEEIDALIELTKKAGARIIGLHVHVGSGVQTSETWSENAVFLASMAKKIGPDVRILNLGGGLGVPQKSTDPVLDMEAVADSLRMFKEANPEFELWMEPGRYCVATAGVLLATITQMKAKQDHVYIGVDAGMNALIRPSLYGAYHEIVNLTRLDEQPMITADIVGPICETGDVLGYGRRMPLSQEGDVLLIATAGAYGRAMSSEYNRREPPVEVIL